MSIAPNVVISNEVRNLLQISQSLCSFEMTYTKSVSYYVYILSNFHNTVFYTGITNNLIRRVYEHKQKLVPGFTSKYNIIKLLYYEEYPDVRDALNREKQIKDCRREKKIALINKMNPTLNDLSSSITE